MSILQEKALPVTQGAGNPDWGRDETLLALDLLYRHGRPLDKRNAEVDDLSAILRAARIHPVENRRPSFRNADGVALKLQNLMSALDPARSLSSSALDRALVDEFPQSRAAELARLAGQIRSAIDGGEVAEPVDADELFAEGQLLTTRHRSRERQLRMRLLRKRSDDQLVCQICNFAPPPLDRSLRESFFEAHHIRPLASFDGPTATRLSDMALVCANCHRFIHRLIAGGKRWFSIDQATKRLKG